MSVVSGEGDPDSSVNSSRGSSSSSSLPSSSSFSEKPVKGVVIEVFDEEVISLSCEEDDDIVFDTMTFPSSSVSCVFLFVVEDAMEGVIPSVKVMEGVSNEEEDDNGFVAVVKDNEGREERSVLG